MQNFALLFNNSEAMKIKLFLAEESGENLVLSRWCPQ